MGKAQRPKSLAVKRPRPHLEMSEDESYGAVCGGKWNFDPIRNRRPDLVWQELEKATARTRVELKGLGWRVKKIKLSELPPRPAPVMVPADSPLLSEPKSARVFASGEYREYRKPIPPTFMETYGWPLTVVAVVLVILAASWF